MIESIDTHVLGVIPKRDLDLNQLAELTKAIAAWCLHFDHDFSPYLQTTEDSIQIIVCSAIFSLFSEDEHITPDELTEGIFGSTLLLQIVSKLRNW